MFLWEEMGKVDPTILLILMKVQEVVLAWMSCQVSILTALRVTYRLLAAGT